MTSRHQWDHKQTALLRRLYQQRNLSTSDIAERFGVSENAIIGKAHRIGINRDGSPSRCKGERGLAKKRQPEKIDAPPPDRTLAHDRGRWLPFFELRPGDCRWPNDAGNTAIAATTFCCAPALVGKSYCEEHGKASLAKLVRAA